MFHRPLCLLLLAASAACAQTPNPADRWAAVEQLPVGKHIEIRTPQRWLNCAFIGADNASVSCHVNAANSLLLTVPAHDETVSRGDVDSLRTFGKSGAVVGAAIGAGAGVILGVSVSDNAGGRAYGALLGGLAAGFLGYIFGSLVDGIRYIGPHHPLYRRP